MIRTRSILRISRESFADIRQRILDAYAHAPDEAYHYLSDDKILLGEIALQVDPNDQPKFTNEEQLCLDLMMYCAFADKTRDMTGDQILAKMSELFPDAMIEKLVSLKRTEIYV